MNLTEAQKATETILAEVYKCGYEEGRCKGYNNRKIEEEFEDKSKDYEKGLNDAWELARKIVLPIVGTKQPGYSEVGYKMDEMKEIWNRTGYARILEDFTAKQAFEKLREYEKKQEKATNDEISVGDEFKSLSGGNCIITRVDNDGVYAMWSDGSVGIRAINYLNDNFKKTGRKFPQIAELLKYLSGESTSNTSDEGRDMSRLCMKCTHGDLSLDSEICEECFFDNHKPNFEQI